MTVRQILYTRILIFTLMWVKQKNTFMHDNNSIKCGIFAYSFSRETRLQVYDLRNNSCFLLADKVEGKFIKSSTFKNLEDWMICGARDNVEFNQVIKFCTENLRLSFCCISTKSIAFSP